MEMSLVLPLRYGMEIGNALKLFCCKSHDSRYTNDRVEKIIESLKTCICLMRHSLNNVGS